MRGSRRLIKRIIAHLKSFVNRFLKIFFRTLNFYTLKYIIEREALHNFLEKHPYRLRPK